jgi:hypothetical protein
MPEINIERLSLSLSGLSEEEGRHLAQLIADGLAEASVSDAAPGSDALQSRATVRPGSSMPDLAEQIVADLVRQLNRTL